MSVSSARTVEGGNSDQRWEAHRLEAVAALDILDTSPEKPFDRIARLVKAALDVDTALISFIDAHRQWHKANVGMDDQQIPLQETLCRHVVKYGGPLIVQDARQDPRFAKSRLVTAEHGLRFYAGIPLKTRDGFVVGTLCAIDREPRKFPARDLDLLQGILLPDMMRDGLRGFFSVPHPSDVLRASLHRALTLIRCEDMRAPVEGLEDDHSAATEWVPHRHPLP